jgi:hypothetical protein
MGATSVTGVSGAGSVAGYQKGSEHMSLSVKKLIGPHIIACGTATMSSSTAVVEFPAPSGLTTDYVVMLTNTTGATSPYVSVAIAAVANTADWDFTIHAGASDVVNWCVVKTGL